MSWVDKAHRRNKVAKDVDKILKDKRFIEANNHREEQAVLQAMCWLAFIGCEYLEMQHRYKKMETNKPPNNARAAFKRDVRKEYGVKQYLTKWGVDMKGVIADGQVKTEKVHTEQSKT